MKWEALAALPPLPKTKICRSSASAWRNRLMSRATPSAVVASFALLRSFSLDAPSREFQRPDRHRIFPQPRQAHRRAGVERAHDEPRQLARDGFPQRVAHERQAAAEDDHLRVEQVD